VASQADDDEIGDDEIGARDNTAQAKARASASTSPFDKACKKEVKRYPSFNMQIVYSQNVQKVIR
jgi:hypothetical protein